MMRSWAYNRFGVLMGTSWRASDPRWPSLRADSLPMITLFPSQGDFCATAFIGVGARPVAIGRLMDQLLEIADGVIQILLGVVAHRLAVAGLGQVDAELVVPGGLRLRELTDVLAARGVDQPVDGVIGIVALRRHDLAVEVDRLLGVVADVGDVAGGVVGIEQVLEARRAARRAGLQMDQAEGLLVIGVLGQRAVAVVDAGALALGVVVDVGDRMQIGRRRVEQARLGSAVCPSQASTRSSRLASL